MGISRAVDLDELSGFAQIGAVLLSWIIALYLFPSQVIISKGESARGGKRADPIPVVAGKMRPTGKRANFLRKTLEMEIKLLCSQ